MGQSLSLATLPGGSAGIEVPELSDVTYEKSLGAARLMKCVRARHQDGIVVVKLVMKPLATFELAKYVKAIRSERDRLSDVPNALGYQRIFETSTNGYLVRQFFYSSLYDRLSTRPFLEDIEKKWLAYQLLCVVRDSHARDVYHGDIKTENILVTSWNWLYLTDYSASYKPTRLPEDNPADFSYYFDTSGRRTCYLAPERFLSATDIDDGRTVTWAMDVFSAGCVIAELFTEAPIFNLSQLFKYRNGEYDPKYSYLSKIQDEDVRELVSHMIQVQPESRYSAEEYLNFWRRKAFPEYFYSFLHQYMGLITDPSSGRSTVHSETSNFGEADDRIDKVFLDFDKISYFLGYEDANDTQDPTMGPSSSSDNVLPIHIDIPSNRHQAGSVSKRPADDGSLIFLTLVVSSLRHTARSSARIRACDLLLAFAERVTDEAKLDRILPYLMVLLNDRVDGVKIAALRSVTQILALVRTISPVNAYAFTEYIKPRLQQFIGGPGTKISPLARAVYALCLASIAHSSIRLLDMIQALRANGSVPTMDPDTEDGIGNDLAYQDSFDIAKADLLDHFEAHTKALLTDRNASVRRAFLGSVSSLCVFFGTPRSNDVILSHLNTYLNDKDWILKCAFFQTVVGVATFFGGPSLEEFILPLMIQALTDPEAFVVQRVLSSFASMAELGLLQRSKTWEMVDIAARFLSHPNMWIREAAVHFVAASTRYISIADRHCIVAPILQPSMKTSLADFSEVAILDSLKMPLPLPVLHMALTWATKAKSSFFWKSIQQGRAASFSSQELDVSKLPPKDARLIALCDSTRNEEDEQWIKRLRSVGMSLEDESKLIALKEYLYRLASRSPQTVKDVQSSNLDDILSLKDFNVTPQTVFFEAESRRSKGRVQSPRNRSTSSRGKAKGSSRTITDALLDASSTVDDPLAQRKRSYANARKERLNVLKLPHGQSRERTPGSSEPATPLSGQSKPPHVPRDNSKAESMEPTNRTGVDPTEGELSDSTNTPNDSIKAPSISDKPTLKHRPSAIQLLSRRDTIKTPAGTSTAATVAVGRMGGPLVNESTGDHRDQRAEKDLAVRDEKAGNPSFIDGGHTYCGSDPSVIKLLDSLAADNYPRDIIDFGPLVTPVSKRHSIKKPDTQKNEQPWRPQGVLVATFGEHTGQINRILPSPDHAFFITGSDDGSVKVWDTLRLERNLAHRSRQTYLHTEDAKVKALCFVENTHTFVSAASDGSIKVVKIEYKLVGDSPKYGKVRVMRDYRLRNRQHAVWLEHAKVDNASLLLVATNTSNIIALDLKDMTELYTLTNPVHHGIPTCFCVNHKQGWLVVSTSHGVLDLWDLRFHLRLKALGLAGGIAIHRVTDYSFQPHERRVCVTGGTGRTDVTIWDLEKGECREVFRTSSSKNGQREKFKPYEAWKLDDEKPESMLDRFGTTSGGTEDASTRLDPGFRALAVGLDTSDDSRHKSRAGFILTGGPSKLLRFWDCTSTSASKVISGLEAEEQQPKYSTSQPKTSLIVHTERGTQRSSAEADKPSRNTLINLQQQTLLRNHLDEITDVCLLEAPVGMTVSVDRMGCIYVFQ